MHYKFTQIFFISLFSSLGFILLLGILIDPFDIYHAPTIKGFNENKVARENQLRLVIALALGEQKPKAIIIGSSRTKNGINPEDVEKETGTVFFNSSLHGANFDEIYEYFLYALKIQPQLKSVIIGIDLFAFNKNRPPVDSSYTKRLQNNRNRIENLIETIFSWTALKSEWITFFANISSTQFFESVPENFQIKYTPTQGILDMGELKYLKFMLANEHNYKDYAIGEDKIEKFRNLVSICKTSGIDLRVFICPLRALYWEFYYQNGLWPSVEQLKKELCESHPIWDFSGFTPLTAETMDSHGEPLYIECSHFTPCAGRMLLKQMYEGPENSELGCLLTPETLNTHLAQILDDRQKWLQGPGKDIHVKFD